MARTDTTPAGPTKRSRLGTVADGALLTLVFVLGLVASTVLHANTKPLRSLLGSALNTLVADTFYGQVRVEEVERVTLDSIQASRISVRDEYGERVLTLRDIRLELDAIGNLKRYINSDPLTPWTLVFPHARVERARVLLVADPKTGSPTLAQALTPKPTPPSQKSGPAQPSSQTRVWFPTIELGRVTGQFKMPSLEDLSPRVVAVQGSLLISPKGVAVDVNRFGVRVLGLDVRLRGTGSVKLRAPGPLEVEFSGFAADSEVQASASLLHNQLTATLSSPRLTPRTLSQLWPASPLTTPVSVRATGAGPLPQLDVELTVIADDEVESDPLAGAPPTTTARPASKLEAQANLQLWPTFRADVDTQLAGVSLALFGPQLPATSIDATLQTSLVYSDTTLTLQSGATIAPTEVNGVPIPPLALHVTSDGERIDAAITVDEPGAKADVSLAYSFTTRALDADVNIPSLYLQDQRRVPNGLRGHASLRGKVSLTEERLLVDAHGALQNVAVAGLRVGRATVDAHTQQAPDHLTQSPARFSIQAKDVAFGSLAFAKAEANGTLTPDRLWTKLSFEDPDGRSLHANGGYDFRSQQLSDVYLSAKRGRLSGTAHVAHFDPLSLAIEVDSLEVTSADCDTEPTCPRVNGFGRYRPGLVEGQLHARAVTLQRLGPIIGVWLPVTGVVNVDADVAIGSDLQRVALSASAEQLSVLGYNQSEVELTASLVESRVRGEVSVRDATGIHADGSWDAQIQGSPFTAQAWERLTGTGSVSVSNVSLQALPWLVRQQWLSSLDGDAGLRLKLQRSKPSGYPTVFAELGVSKLQADVQTSAEAKPVSLPEQDLYVSATFDPEQKVLYATGSLRDLVGTLLTATGSMPLVPDAWFSPVPYRQAVANSPISLNLNLQPRALKTLPLLSDTPFSGTLESQVVVYGTVAAPEIKTFLSLQDFMTPGLRRNAPVTLQSNAHYAMATSDLSLELVGASLGKSVLMGKAVGLLPWPLPEQGDVFQGDARLALDGLPLSIFSPLSDLELSGEVTGLVELSQSSQQALRVLLDFEKVTSGRAPVGSGTLRATAAGGLMKSELVLERENQQLLLTLDAFSDASGLPSPSQISRVNALLRMRQMNAAAFSPLLSGILARLTGELDSNVAFEWERDLSAPQPEWGSRVSGIAHLRNGRAYVDGVGLELQDVTVDAVATPLGKQTHLMLDRVRAKARSQQVNFEGRGQLLFTGAQVTSGSASAVLRQVPLTLQGLNVGQATGAVSATMQRRDSWDKPGPYRGKPYLLVDATLNNWRMRAAPSASRSLIAVGRNPEIEVLQDVTVAPTHAEVLPYRVNIGLGQDVRFSLSELDLPLSGGAQIDYTDTATVYGTIVLERGGRVPIFGRVFEVQDGSLRLNPAAPSNPDIDISLAGRSKDGSPVYVSLSGTLQDPLVNPPLSQLQDLLGGGTATALSGGVQALGLNSLLGDAVQLRVASTDDEQQLSRYSAAMQIQDNLWFEVNYQRNQTSGFTQQDQDAVSGTLDYRFNDNWSLRTEAGTTGGSVDAVWQYRY